MSSCATGYISDAIRVQKAGVGEGGGAEAGWKGGGRQHRSRVFDVTAGDCKNEG